MRGDSLSLIAAAFDTTWQSLVYWNRDRYQSLDPAQPGYDPNRIEVGWRLVVWPGLVVGYNPPLPTPSLRPTPQPTKSPQTASALVSHGSRSSGMVALTFDMGGRTEPAVAIMSWLRDHGVPATVFMTGASVNSTSASRQVISIINRQPGLFDLGNHSYSHPDMTGLTAGQVTDELRRAETAIEAYANQSPRPLFRPPYGAWDSDVLAGAGAAGYRATVLWDVDTIDWKPMSDGGPSAAKIVETVVGRAQGGSIVLMHLGGYKTLDALPGIVAGLRDRGFTLVTLGTLLGY
ncbi:MAG TPA: polysaccharide deacetylase family protein [Candidatus Limnocylindria bacterium]|nr:polysaccharide deacetylase family protein [Candidatus Limnocylindria bacterium]